MGLPGLSLAVLAGPLDVQPPNGGATRVLGRLTTYQLIELPGTVPVERGIRGVRRREMGYFS